jgi:hypothetical protein
MEKKRARREIMYPKPVKIARDLICLVIQFGLVADAKLEIKNVWMYNRNGGEEKCKILQKL